MTKPKFAYWLITLDDYIKIRELAIKNGKKPGESMQEEFKQYIKERPERIKLIGISNKDIDMLTGDLREKGKKILNMKELERRKKKEEDKT